ncbi:MAG: hypothetical protein Kow0073_14900 [Immundisolibacter sp.]
MAPRRTTARQLWPWRAGPAGVARGEAPGARTNLRRQVVDLYRHGRLPALLSVSCGLGLVLVLWPVLSMPILTAWLLMHLLLAAGRLRLVGRFRRQRVADDHLWRWRNRYVGVVLATGLLWGGGSVLLVMNAPVVQQLLAWVVLSAAVLVEFPALARLGRPFFGLLVAALASPLGLMLLGTPPLPAGAGALLLLALASALAGMQLCGTYRDGLQLELSLARLARLDQLTGLANRRCFDEVLAGEWRRAERYGGDLALVMFDVDEFKLYNDHFGHPAGDACLRRLAHVVRTVVHRQSDRVARLGGEEFAVVLPQTRMGGALAVAETLRQAVENLKLPHAPGAAREVVTISAGVASLRPGVERRIEDLIEAADQALYAAKRAGRNRVVAAPADGAADLQTRREPVSA